MTAPIRPPTLAPAAPGPLAARLAAGPADLRAAQALRHLCFVEARGRPPRPGGLDADRHDVRALHVLVEDAAGALAACCRLRVLGDRDLGTAYAAAAYDLRPLARAPFPLLELGRLCVRPGAHGPGSTGPDALRAMLGAAARVVDAHGVGLIFGCASFEGTDPAPHAPALAHLARHHAAPAHLAPRPLAGALAPERVALPDQPADPAAAVRAMPPLLRAYLSLGAWTSDHAVIDRDLGTLHVLAAVETARIPPARARALRAPAG